MSATESSADGQQLRSSRVLITGAGGGIGRSLVARFRAAGCSIAGADRDPAALDGLPVDCRLTFDLADASSTSQSIARLTSDFGLPDILVSNAGYTRAETIEQVDLAAWQSEVDVNLTGAYRVAAPLASAMARRGHGSIVFISSVNGLMHFGNPAYSAAKAGLIAYSRALAVEYGRHGVRTNVVCPGSVRTPAWDHRLAKSPALLEKVLPHYPLGRLVTPDEVAAAVLFLASPAASGITGIVLPVDAGLTAGNLRFVRDVIEGNG
jgi:NAD(P)-dependent dehydrogenase (short-subunit alcohol dehydrogenase family)